MKKKIILISASVSIVAMFIACAKTKDFNCECTYVASASGPNAGAPNKVENTTVKGRLHEQASIECSNLEGKYIAEFFSGTCLIK